jgi:hypothetical protein
MSDAYRCEIWFSKPKHNGYQNDAKLTNRAKENAKQTDTTFGMTNTRRMMNTLRRMANERMADESKRTRGSD